MSELQDAQAKVKGIFSHKTQTYGSQAELCRKASGRRGLERPKEENDSLLWPLKLEFSAQHNGWPQKEYSSFDQCKINRRTSFHRAA